MSIFNNMLLGSVETAGSSADLGDPIEQSLRFWGSTTGDPTFTRTYTFGEGTNIVSDGTFSFWVKFGNLANDQTLISTDPNGGGANRWWLVRADDSIKCRKNPGGFYTFNTRKYRDPSAWYHVFLKVTASTIELHINGVSVGSVSNQVLGNIIENGELLRIGGEADNTGFLDGYLADFYFIDQSNGGTTSLTPSDFGRLNTDDVWVPQTPTNINNYGNCGFHLTFDSNQSPNNVGTDSSGQGNHFTATGFTADDKDYTDTPTSNYPTFNPIHMGKFQNNTTDSLFKANLDFRVQTQAFRSGVTNFVLPDSGKYYCEITFTNTLGHLPGLGVAELGFNNYDYGMYDPGVFCLIIDGNNNVRFYRNTVFGSGPASPIPPNALNGTIQMAVNCDTSPIEVNMGVENEWYNSSGTASAVGTLPQNWASFTPNIGTADGYMITAFQLGPSTVPITFNGGQKPFNYTPPTGYEPLRAANLPEPLIKKGEDHFTVSTYNASNPNNPQYSSFNNTGLYWVKAAETSTSTGNELQHQLVDSLRGQSARHCPATQPHAATYDPPAGPSRMWFWSAPDAFTHNQGTDGATHTSTGFRNVDAGFSMVKFNLGNMSPAIGNVAHGLSQEPEFILTWVDVMSGFGSASNINCWHKDLTPGHYIRLNNQLAETYSHYSDYFGNTATPVTPTLFNGSDYEGLGNDVYAYLWHSVPGYSSIGSYWGNADADGEFVYTGFKPAFLLCKQNLSSSDWHIRSKHDTEFNPLEKDFILTTDGEQNANGEDTNYEVDFLSNGFKMRCSNSELNPNYSPCIYAAFAEHPFGGTNAPPVTAH